MNNSQNVCTKNYAISKVSGVDNVLNMMSDINSNFLSKNTTSELLEKCLTPNINTNQNTAMEILGSHVYEKCGRFLLAPVSYFVYYI